MWVGGPCQPRARTGRKPQTSSGSQTTSKPVSPGKQQVDPLPETTL
jgi:hypothetical protein